MLRRRLVLGLVVCAGAGLLAPGFGVPPAGAGGPTAQNVFTMSWLEGVVCRPDRTCLGAGDRVDGGAVGVLSAPGVVGPVRLISGTRSLDAITCLPTGNCIAVGEGRRGSAATVELRADGTPVAVHPVVGATHLYDVACPTATTCLATGAQVTRIPDYPYSSTVPVFVVLTNGVPGPVQRYPRGPRRFIGIDCPTAARCLAVGGGAIAVFTNGGGSWTVAYRPPGPRYPGEDISCPSASSCYTTAVGGVQTPEGTLPVPAILELSADGVPGVERMLSERSGSLHGISCVAEWTCTLVGGDNPSTQGLVIDVTPSGPPVVTIWENSNYFSDVSCVSATACGMVGTVGGTPPLPIFAWKG